MTDLSLIHEALSHRYFLRPMPQIDADTELSDIGVDSLDRVTMALALEERIGREIPDCEISRWRTVGDVLAVGGGL